MKIIRKYSEDSVNVRIKPSPIKEVRIAKNLRGLFINQLLDIYWTEKALIKASSKMTNDSISKGFREDVQIHLAETSLYPSRLENIFSTLKIKSDGKINESISGLIKEAEQIIKVAEGTAV